MANSNERNNIIRVVHNRENPFVQLNKSALWDSRLSLKSTGLWARCMSRPNDWKFSVAELAKNCKEGRRSIDASLQELIEVGYAMRMEYTVKKNGRYTERILEYVFFEFPATEEEKLEQLEIFKKSFLNCGFSNCGFSNCRIVQLLRKSSTKKEDSLHESKTETSLKVPEEPTANAVMSAKADEVEDHSPPIKKLKTEPAPEVKELAIAILSAMRDIKPDYKAPSSTAAIETQIDLMIRRDFRKPQEIIDVIKWALSDAFWCDKMFKPNPAKYLRDHYDQLQIKMVTKLPEKGKIDRRLKNITETNNQKHVAENLF